ncbi:long-chain fatty acid--CoA ligase [Bradyrhizobium sp. KBS0727]|uniref:acyl-CoA synthetase n=1 Tax=unclassified Bradyrhizobium TaxID=2631580 RepID=UPI00110ED045|nr:MULTISPECIES: long-chain fatty acid--CoA ligase [unclassified Bradyrhizobium]QDW36220.1 long-chain fatty acid--CoA ligase [Bradyrhizobium sp. KBS0725]QDW42821.1 long-chain fatty acid--CoA ligase [Bradyrhizobium sp. KBS0727]
MSVRYYDWIAHFGRRTPDKTAVIDLASQRRLSYTEFDRRIARLAGHLRDALKVERGDRVAVLALNTTDTLEVQFACFRIGAVFLPLNNRLTVPELQFIVGDASPKVMVHDTDLAETALTVAKLCNVASALLLGPGGSYEAAIAASKPLENPETVTLDDISTIMYTSGTTGQPKGAIITHGMTFWNCVNLGGPAYISPSTVLLTVLPLFHTGGLNCYTNPVLHSGGTVLIMRTFDPGVALQLISDVSVGINQFFGVPSIYQFMAQHPSFATADFSRLVIGGVGGAPMPVPLLKVWEERGVALQQGYGMTETSPAVLTLDKEDAVRKAGSSGKPVMHTEVRIVRPDGSDAGIDELGELWVRGPNVTPGYWNRPDANASSFTDGWLHTGDATRVDAEGFYFIVDRWKDMYISGGENVYPAEVESVLHQIPAVAEAAVIGIPNEQWGEVGMAIVAIRPGHTLAAEEIHAHCAANLARFKCPRLIEFVEALPRNATGKIHKPTLRNKFGAPKATDTAKAIAS